MGRACIMREDEEEDIYIVGGKTMKKEYHSKDVDVGWSIILKWISEEWDGVI
jgi:hypothetical protein